MQTGSWQNARRELPRLKEKVLVSAHNLGSPWEVAVFRGDAFALLSGRYQGKLLSLIEVDFWLRPIKSDPEE